MKLTLLKNNSYSILLLLFYPILAAAEQVKIGLIIPLTGSQAVYGQDAQRAVKILAPDGKIKRDNFEFEIILEDGKCGLGSSAITAAHKLINLQNVKFLVVGCSGEALQVGPLAEKSGVLMISYAGGHPDVRNIGKFAFRTYVDLSKATDLIANRIKQDSHTKIALITEESSFTVGIKKLLQETLKNKVVYLEDFHVDEGDFRTVLTKARSNKPTAYYLNAASPNSYMRLYSQLRQLQIDADVYSYHMPSDPVAIKELGELQNGVKFIGTPEVGSGNEEFEKFLIEYKKHFPDGPNTDILLRTSYDALMSIVKGVERVGPTPSLVAEYLHSNKTSGAIGTLEFDNEGDVIDLNFVLKEIVNGKPVSLQ